MFRKTTLLLVSLAIALSGIGFASDIGYTKSDLEEAVYESYGWCYEDLSSEDGADAWAIFTEEARAEVILVLRKMAAGTADASDLETANIYLDTMLMVEWPDYDVSNYDQYQASYLKYAASAKKIVDKWSTGKNVKVSVKTIDSAWRNVIYFYTSIE